MDGDNTVASMLSCGPRRVSCDATIQIADYDEGGGALKKVQVWEGGWCGGCDRLSTSHIDLPEKEHVHRAQCGDEGNCENVPAVGDTGYA